MLEEKNEPRITKQRVVPGQNLATARGRDVIVDREFSLMRDGSLEVKSVGKGAMGRLRVYSGEEATQQLQDAGLDENLEPIEQVKK